MGKFMKHLKCKKTETIELCPICNSFPIEEDMQPQAGTHMFTRVYECLTEIDFPIGYDGAEYGVTCNGEIKRFEMPEVNKISNAEKQHNDIKSKEDW